MLNLYVVAESAEHLAAGEWEGIYQTEAGAHSLAFGSPVFKLECEVACAEQVFRAPVTICPECKVSSAGGTGCLCTPELV